MKSGKIKYVILMAVAFAMVSVSCSKGDSEEEVPSIEGSLNADVPMFALVGSTIKMNASGVIYPESGVRYGWYNADFISDTLWGQSVQITIPDTLGTFSVSLIAKAKGYYQISASKEITFLKRGYGNSLTGFPEPKDSIMDSRDGQWYYIKEIGNLIWFTNNLNWAGAGEGYSKADDAGYALGRLYTWEDATGGISKNGLGQGPQGVCPQGWSIPTNADWEDFGKTLNGGVAVAFIDDWSGLARKVMVKAYLNTEHSFWPYNGLFEPSNDYGWNAISAGSSTDGYNRYSGIYAYGFWWSSTEYASDKAQYRYLFHSQETFPMNYTSKDSFASSIRCVKKR
jgi:uncharacterized protein (TIGR02145 family)